MRADGSLVITVSDSEEEEAAVEEAEEVMQPTRDFEEEQ
jgi:hypothetical protein